MIKKMATEFSGKKAFEYCKHLAVTIGPRLTGSDGEHKAARYIAKMFRSFGLKTRFQKFPVTTFASRKCTFEVFDRGRWRSLQAQPIGLSHSTPPGGLQGKLHLLESAEPEHFTSALTDKIVLLCDGLDVAKLPKFLARKPKALVFIEGGISDEPIRKAVREHERRYYGDLPMARIGHLDGLDIVRKALRRGRLTMRLTERRSYGLNVIGERLGDVLADEIVVICGHYDSSMGISGASDNAGGTAVMMELARVLLLRPSRRTLRFIGFACEETGLQGSKHYAAELEKAAERQRKRKTFDEKTHTTELDKHRLVFNLDVHGCILGRLGCRFNGIEDVAASVRLLAKELGIATSVERGPMSSDGSALAAAGVPAVQLARSGGTTRYLHSSLDVIRFLSPEALGKAGAFSEMFLRRYVTEGVAFPFPREIPEDQKKKLKDYRRSEDEAKTKARAARARARKAAPKRAKKAGRRAARR